MKCPVCSNTDTKVIDTRLSRNGVSVRRRRECEKCGHRFSTGEEIELLDLVVVKRDGRREGYQREKVEAGLRKSLEKRPHTSEEFTLLVRLIERDLQRKRTREIKSAEIGEIIMKRLKQFDKVGYIRFASVYLAFDDIDTFADAVRELTSAKTHQKKHAARSRKYKET